LRNLIRRYTASCRRAQTTTMISRSRNLSFCDPTLRWGEFTCSHSRARSLSRPLSLALSLSLFCDPTLFSLNFFLGSASSTRFFNKKLEVSRLYSIFEKPSRLEPAQLECQNSICGENEIELSWLNSFCEKKGRF